MRCRPSPPLYYRSVGNNVTVDENHRTLVALLAGLVCSALDRFGGRVESALGGIGDGLGSVTGHSVRDM